jgi:tetratricopeptide (TPR) repeat protein
LKSIKLLILFLTFFSWSFSQTKDELFEAGKDNYEKGWLITAVDYFSDAIKLDSNFANAYYYRGLTYTKGALSDCYSPAVDDFYKCIKLQPDSNFWQAYLYIADRKLFPDTSALKYFDKAIELNPTNYLLYQKRGFLKQWNRMFFSALTDYSKSLELNDKDFVTYDFKASTEIQTGEYLIALVDIDKAIELNSKYAKLYSDKSFILCKLKENKAAKKNKKKAKVKTGEIINCDCCEMKSD